MLGLAHYPSLMDLLQPRTQREMAAKIVGALLRGGGTHVRSQAQVEMLFRCGVGWAGWVGVRELRRRRTITLHACPSI